MKGPPQDQGEGVGDSVPQDPQKQQAAADVEKAKDRHDPHAEGADGAYAPDDDYARKEGGCHPGNMGRDLPAGSQGVGDRGSLGGAAHSQGRAQDAEGVEQGKAPAAQAVLKDVHRASHAAAVGFLPVEKTAQEAFGVGSGHSQDPCHPAPEQGAGAAQGDGCGHSHDISGAQGGCQGGGQGRETAQVRSVSGGRRVGRDGEADGF